MPFSMIVPPQKTGIVDFIGFTAILMVMALFDLANHKQISKLNIPVCL